MTMALIDNISIKQTFDPKGENGGYKFEVLPEPNTTDPTKDIEGLPPIVPIELPTLTEDQEKYLNDIMASGGVVLRDEHSGQLYRESSHFKHREYFGLATGEKREPTQGTVLKGEIPEPPVADLRHHNLPAVVEDLAARVGLGEDDLDLSFFDDPESSDLPPSVAEKLEWWDEKLEVMEGVCAASVKTAVDLVASGFTVESIMIDGVEVTDQEAIDKMVEWLTKAVSPEELVSDYDARVENRIIGEIKMDGANWQTMECLYGLTPSILRGDTPLPEDDLLPEEAMSERTKGMLDKNFAKIAQVVESRPYLRGDARNRMIEDVCKMNNILADLPWKEFDGPDDLPGIRTRWR